MGQMASLIENSEAEGGEDVWGGSLGPGLPMEPFPMEMAMEMEVGGPVLPMELFPMEMEEEVREWRYNKHVVLEVDPMENFINEILDSTRGKPSHRPTIIFRVPEDIRKIDAAAYSPKVVSIGLLHQQEGLRLDEHKWHYLYKVLSRSKNKLNVYIKEMEETAVKAAFCYPGYPESADMAMWFREFEMMMLVDGCFIINLLLQLEVGLVEINDPIYSNRWTLPGVGHDMLLLENQLPFFVLEKLWELTGRERPTLKTNVLRFFQNLLPEEHDLKPPETEDVHHLLHLIHLSLQPASSSKKPDSTSGTRIAQQDGPKAGLPPHERELQPKAELPPDVIMMAELMPHERELQPHERPAPPPKTIPSATELQEAGVKLKRPKRRRARSFLDVTFEQGLMQIPRLTISDSTNSLFRNFIAFEQGFPDCGNHFASYCIFMDSLINTSRDVEILKQAGIIEHVLGSDEEVATLFNKLSRGITWEFKDSYLAKLFEDVNKHTQKRCPKWRAKLVHDYFSNPWVILSLIAAIVILILTFLQAYFGIFSYFRPRAQT